jgi:hypothetical protein
MYSEMLQPEDVEGAMGLHATGGHLKGQLRSRRNKTTWPDSMWRFGTSPEVDRNLESNLAWVLDHIEPRRNIVHAFAEKYSVDFFCGFSPGNREGGFTLSPAILSRIARMGVPTIVNLSPPQALVSDENDAAGIPAEHVLGGRKWSTAALRIIGEELQEREIEPPHALGKTCFHQPQLWLVPGGEARWGPMWSFISVLGDERGVTEHLRSLFDSLEPWQDMLKRLSAKFYVDILCGFSSASGQGGFVLDATTLARAASLGVPIGVELYRPGPIGRLGD